MPSDLLAGLNPEQRRAAEAVRGPVCVLAGAGTGKTRTVTHRIAHQIATRTAHPQQILAVTFTEKAARELRTRLHGLGVPPVRAATFHGAAWAQLRHFLPRRGERVPEVLSSKFRILIPLARRTNTEARDLAAEIEWAKARMLGPEQYAARAGQRDAPLDPTQMAEVYATYERQKDAAGALDFEDMLLRMLNLLRDTEVAAEVRDRYRYLTVDEYQDVNPMQQALLEAWLGDGEELCVVGDDDQTIYSFTGATSAYLTRFRRRWPQATLVTLTRSYRSTAPILDLANRVLWTKPAALRKRLTTTRTDGPAPAFSEHADAEQEVNAVVTRIAALAEAGVPYREMAVLYRTNAQSEPYEEALREAQVPSSVRGDDGGFFARTEVRQALRLLVAERDRGPDADPASLLAGTGAEPPPVRRRVEQALRSGLGWRPDREPDGGVARERWRNLVALADAADRRAGDGETFDEVVTTLQGLAAAGAEAPGEGGAVTLASLHRAKGLEFEAVFLVALEEGLLPISYAKTDAEVEEERRLLYVGVTRAKTHLWLSWARSRVGWGGRTQTRRPSRLLYNLGDGAPQSGGNDSAGTTGVRGAPKGGGARAPQPQLRHLTGHPAEVAEALRDWRRERSARDEVPAFVVFSDKTLAARAQSPPSDSKELLHLPGRARSKSSGRDRPGGWASPSYAEWDRLDLGQESPSPSMSWS